MTKRQNGFTLIEVLIAFIILAVGLLAIVSLQASSKQNTHQAMQRSLAVSYAESIIERIRANPTAIATYVAQGTIGGGSIEAQPQTCIDTFCNVTQLAQNDMWVLEQKLDGAAATITDGGVTTNTTGLIAPTLCMVFTNRAGLVNSGFLTVRVQWQGLASISDAVTTAGDNCDAAVAANSDPFRRQIELNTYIIDETEL